MSAQGILTQECEQALRGFRAQNGRRHDRCLLEGREERGVFLLSPLPNLVMWDIFLKKGLLESPFPLFSLAATTIDLRAPGG